MTITSTRLVRLGVLTVLLGVLTTWAMYTRTWLAAPVALGFVLTSFWWHIQRVPSSAAVPPACTGCRNGCPRCRERIDP
jgi:hypothetical protein